MEGKRLAIDSSIWLYQFQATMRDKDGRVLVNAHVLGEFLVNAQSRTRSTDPTQETYASHADSQVFCVV